MSAAEQITDALIVLELASDADLAAWRPYDEDELSRYQATLARVLLRVLTAPQEQA